MNILIFLGLCGYVPGDIELSNRLCEMAMEDKHRDIVPRETLPDRPRFLTEVSQVVWP